MYAIRSYYEIVEGGLGDGEVSFRLFERLLRAGGGAFVGRQGKPFLFEFFRELLEPFRPFQVV